MQSLKMGNSQASQSETAMFPTTKTFKSTAPSGAFKTKRYNTMIKSVPAFVTPEDMKDLEDRIESYSGGEKAAAWMGAIMAWNLACKMVNEKEATENV